MPRFTWKPNTTVSLRLKDDSYILGQLLKSPYMVFFNEVRKKPNWEATAAENAPDLFFCAVVASHLKFGGIQTLPSVRPKRIVSTPNLWIKRFPGSRRVTCWPGTHRERSLILLSAKPGGQLVEKHLDASGPGNPKVIKPDIALSDHATIDAYELDAIWPYPTLNERLYLCAKLNKLVDPEKDLTFDRPLRDEYETYIDIVSQRGKPEDWGYSSKPAASG